MSSGYSSSKHASSSTSIDVDSDSDDVEKTPVKGRNVTRKHRRAKRARKSKSTETLSQKTIAEEEEEEDPADVTLDDEVSRQQLTEDEQGMCGLTELVTSCLPSSSGSSSKLSTSSRRKLKDDDRMVIDGGDDDQEEDEDDHDQMNVMTAAKRILCSNKTKGSSGSSGSTGSTGSTSPTTNPFLRASQFSGIEPTIRFYTKGTKVTKPARKITNRLTWCHNSLLPVVMRNTLAASHFTIVDESLFYVGYWGRHLKSIQYKSLQPHQKVNHFPGAFHIGRKDRLWMHIRKQQERFGDEFNIMPFTYILPQDRDELMEYLDEDTNRHVIIKPPASARGTGIQVTRKSRDFPVSSPLVAQHYIARPLVINKAKFDLRVYAYVPTLEPLRVYIYDEGLVRFASVPYSSCVSTISNKYMHLTNYSINKQAEKDGVANRPVPKWTLTQLWDWFARKGVDSTRIKRQIDDVILKAFISCEKPIREHMSKFLEHEFISYELFGIDILLDEDLKPWLLEVNISPSLHSGTSLDADVKGPLAKDVLNLAGIRVPPNLDALDEADYSQRARNMTTPKSRQQTIKENAWLAAYNEEGIEEINSRIVKTLMPEDARMLVEMEDELTRKGDFRLIFPTPETLHYQRFFAEPVYANLMLQQWQIDQASDRSVGIARLEELCRQDHLISDQKTKK